MTKLMEWLSAIGILFSIWIYLITNKDNITFVKERYDLVLFSPIISLILFGLYAAFVVIYRVFTFNDCEEAAIELQKEIQEARKELTKLGFKFKAREN